MKPILSRDGLKKLERFLAVPTAVVLDYDGTLSPICLRAGDANLPPKTRRLLKEVAGLYPSAVLSGRKLSDLRARVRGCGLRTVVGNHGLEWPGASQNAKYESLMRRCKRELDHAIRAGAIHGEGIEVENKKVTLSIHYRMSPRRARARHEILAVLLGLRGTQIIEGKQVFNLLPRTRLNKGTAVLALRKKFRCKHVIFSGDDWTDERVFALRPKPFLLDVRVGRSSRSRARYYLPGIAAMNRFLEELIRMGRRHPSRRA